MMCLKHQKAVEPLASQGCCPEIATAEQSMIRQPLSEFRRWVSVENYRNRVLAEKCQEKDRKRQSSWSKRGHQVQDHGFKAHHVNNLRHRGAPHDGVVNEQHILARKHGRHRIQLPAHAQRPHPGSLEGVKSHTEADDADDSVKWRW